MKKNFKKFMIFGLTAAMTAGAAVNVMAASDSYTMRLDGGEAECYIACDDTSAYASTDVYADYQAEIIWASADVQFEGLISDGTYEYIDSDSSYAENYFTLSEGTSASASGDISYSIQKNASSSHAAGIDSDSDSCALSVDY